MFKPYFIKFFARNVSAKSNYFVKKQLFVSLWAKPINEPYRNVIANAGGTNNDGISEIRNNVFINFAFLKRPNALKLNKFKNSLNATGVPMRSIWNAFALRGILCRNHSNLNDREYVTNSASLHFYFTPFKLHDYRDLKIKRQLKQKVWGISNSIQQAPRSHSSRPQINHGRANASHLELSSPDTFWNVCFDKGRLKNFVSWFLKNHGEHKTVELVEQLKNVGFKYATESGLSLGIDDLKIPPRKALLMLEAEKQSKVTINQYNRGEITGIERFQRLIDAWHRTSELLKQEVIDYFEATDILNPVYMMAFSGARGNISQVRQLVGMRGLMADPQGQILDFPIRSNFREGLTLTEYIISCYGARKGIVDTALRTANAGYLTRRLVDVAQHVIISHYDCGTKRGIFLTDMKEGNKTLYSLQNRLIGRVLAKDVKKANSTNNINHDGAIAYRNQEISGDLAFDISKVCQKVFVRSPLTCETKKLVCQLCYGWSLAQGNLVSIGEAVGIIAAQSIGEPGTQLTMRTFHTGGVFSGDVTDQIRAPYSGVVRYAGLIPGTLIRTMEGQIAFLTKGEGVIFVVKSSGTANLNHDSSNNSKSEALLDVQNNSFNQSLTSVAKEKKFKIPAYTVLFIRNGELVIEKQVIAQISSISRQKNIRDDAELTIKTEIEGQFYSEYLEVQETLTGPKLTQKEKEDCQYGFIPPSIKAKLDTIEEAWDWGYAWILSGKIYQLPVPSSFFPKSGDLLDKNSIMNQIQWMISDVGSFSFAFNNYTAQSMSQKRNINNTKSGVSVATKHLEKNILSLNIKQIKYNNIGYFFNFKKAIFNSKDNFISKTTNPTGVPMRSISNAFRCATLDQDSIFVPFSLIEKEPTNASNGTTWNPLLNRFLEWFPKKTQMNTAGLLAFESSFFKRRSFKINKSFELRLAGLKTSTHIVNPKYNLVAIAPPHVKNTVVRTALEYPKLKETKLKGIWNEFNLGFSNNKLYKKVRLKRDFMELINSSASIESHLPAELKRSLPKHIIPEQKGLISNSFQHFADFGETKINSHYFLMDSNVSKAEQINMWQLGKFPKIFTTQQGKMKNKGSAQNLTIPFINIQWKNPLCYELNNQTSALKSTSPYEIHTKKAAISFYNASQTRIFWIPQQLYKLVLPISLITRNKEQVGDKTFKRSLNEFNIKTQNKVFSAYKTSSFIVNVNRQQIPYVNKQLIKHTTYNTKTSLNKEQSCKDGWIKIFNENLNETNLENGIFKKIFMKSSMKSTKRNKLSKTKNVAINKKQIQAKSDFINGVHFMGEAHKRSSNDSFILKDGSSKDKAFTYGQYGTKTLIKTAHFKKNALILLNKNHYNSMKSYFNLNSSMLGTLDSKEFLRVTNFSLINNIKHLNATGVPMRSIWNHLHYRGLNHPGKPNLSDSTKIGIKAAHYQKIYDAVNKIRDKRNQLSSNHGSPDAKHLDSFISAKHFKKVHIKILLLNKICVNTILNSLCTNLFIGGNLTKTENDHKNLSNFKSHLFINYSLFIGKAHSSEYQEVNTLNALNLLKCFCKKTHSCRKNSTAKPFTNITFILSKANQSIDLMNSMKNEIKTSSVYEINRKNVFKHSLSTELIGKFNPEIYHSSKQLKKMLNTKHDNLIKKNILNAKHLHHRGMKLITNYILKPETKKTSTLIYKNSLKEWPKTSKKKLGNVNYSQIQSKPTQRSSKEKVVWIQFKNGWVYKPLKIKIDGAAMQHPKLQGLNKFPHKVFFLPGQPIVDNLVFDRDLVYVECILIPETTSINHGSVNASYLDVNTLGIKKFLNHEITEPFSRIEGLEWLKNKKSRFSPAGFGLDSFSQPLFSSAQRSSKEQSTFMEMTSFSYKEQQKPSIMLLIRKANEYPLFQSIESKKLIAEFTEQSNKENIHGKLRFYLNHGMGYASAAKIQADNIKTFSRAKSKLFLNNSWDSTFVLQKFKSYLNNKQNKTSNTLAKFPNVDINIKSNTSLNSLLSKLKISFLKKQESLKNFKNSFISKADKAGINLNAKENKKMSAAKVTKKLTKIFKSNGYHLDMLVCQKPLNLNSFVIDFKIPYGIDSSFKTPLMSLNHGNKASVTYLKSLKSKTHVDWLYCYEKLLNVVSKNNSFQNKIFNVNYPIVSVAKTRESNKNSLSLFTTLHKQFPVAFEQPCFDFGLKASFSMLNNINPSVAKEKNAIKENTKLKGIAGNRTALVPLSYAQRSSNDPSSSSLISNVPTLVPLSYAESTSSFKQSYANLMKVTKTKALNSTKFYASQNNVISTSNFIAKTSYFSSFEGEVLKHSKKNNTSGSLNFSLNSFNKNYSLKKLRRKTGYFYNQDHNSCLLLTKQDLISFATESNVSLNNVNTFKHQLNSLKLGQFIVNGDVINTKNSVSFNHLSSKDFKKGKAVKISGQIVHIGSDKITIRFAQPIFVSPKAIFHVSEGSYVNAKSSVITLAYQRLKTGDIVQGIPKVEQFFEARPTKAGRLFRDSLPNLLKALYRRYNSSKISVAKKRDSSVDDYSKALSLAKNSKLKTTSNENKNKKNLRHEQAVRQSFYKLQQIIVDGVQRVYLSQGVAISDKHLEIIVKSMTSKVIIIQGGPTGFFPGELIELDFVEKVNSLLTKKIKYEPVVLGITKASLEVNSFLSAASFQQSTKILTAAALSKKKDFLRGLKENVMLGNLIPAGTGYLVWEQI
nr:RNA polymerase beta'' subunit [Chlorosarcina stigmatica]